MNKILFALSLARKAGKLTAGFDRVKEAVLNGEGHLAVIASDISDNTARRVERFCTGKVKAHRIQLTQDDISRVSGRLSGVYALTDENLAKLCENAILQEKGEL